MKAMARALDRRFYGVVEGLVEEIVDPDKEGRIKVRFPWYDDATVTEWCRVCQLYAGPGYGSFFVPEKGDEVLVAFVQGDMRLPIIMGGLYNGKDKPPTDRQKDDDKNHKLVRTKAGHSLLFDDTKDKEKIVLTTKGGHVLELHDPDQGGARFASLRSKNGHELKLDDSSNQIVIRTASGQSVTMDALSGDITVVGATITLAGAISVGLEAPALSIAGPNISLSGASISLGAAAGNRVVLGDALMALFNSHTHGLVPGATTIPNQQMTDAQLSSVAKVE
jgi:phage baseplate assembly protein gpV